jgi:hypothetical protein
VSAGNTLSCAPQLPVYAVPHDFTGFLRFMGEPKKKKKKKKKKQVTTIKKKKIPISL